MSYWHRGREREARSGPRRAAVPDGTREVRSFEATHVGALFHLDGHQGSLKVLNRQGEWITPIGLCVVDDHSRLICHLQWYAHENTQCLVHVVSQAFAHLREVSLRYARWDRSQADIVDPRDGAILATIYPLDKARNAHGQRRSITPRALSSRALSSRTASVPEPTGDGHAPLMRQLLAQFAATGLPPAYLELEQEAPTPSSPPTCPPLESDS
jgi:hypothetical protein